MNTILTPPPDAASSSLDTLRELAASRKTQRTHISYPNGAPLTVRQENLRLLVHDERNGTSRWDIREQSGRYELAWHGPCAASPTPEEFLAAIDTMFAFEPGLAHLTLSAPLPKEFHPLHSRLVIDEGHGRYRVPREMFFQERRLWTPPTAPHPLSYVMSNGVRHPLRPPKPQGIVYQRHIPWLDKTLAFCTVDADRDVAVFHRWMNDPDVAYFWEEQGEVEHHRKYLQRVLDDPHTLPLIAALDDEVFGYFEVYWAREDRIAPFYAADDFDRGWHVLIGEPRFRGKAFLTAWMPSISHYLFLDHPRTRRIVIEPRTDNRKMLRSLPQCGYDLIKEFDFPHKRAMLAMLERERFFSDAIWITHTPHDVVTTITQTKL